jgi:hypothetical protein
MGSKKNVNKKARVTMHGPTKRASTNVESIARQNDNGIIP